MVSPVEPLGESAYVDNTTSSANIPPFPEYAPEEKQKFTQVAETARQSTQQPGASEGEDDADGAQQPSELQVVNEETREALETATRLLRNPSSVVEDLDDIDGVAGIATARQENDKTQPTEAAEKGLAELKRAQEALRRAMEDQAAKLQETTAELSPEGVTKRTDVAEIAPGTTPEVAEGAREVLAEYYREEMQNAQEAASRVARLQRQIAERATEMSGDVLDRVDADRIARETVIYNLQRLVTEVEQAQQNPNLCIGGRSCATFKAITGMADVVQHAIINLKELQGVSREDLQAAEERISTERIATRKGTIETILDIAREDKTFRRKLEEKLTNMGYTDLDLSDPSKSSNLSDILSKEDDGRLNSIFDLAEEEFQHEIKKRNPLSWKPRRGYMSRRKRVMEAMQTYNDERGRLNAQLNAERYKQLTIEDLVEQYREELDDLSEQLKGAVKDMLAHTAAANALSLAMHAGVVTTAVERTMEAASNSPSGESFDPTKPVVGEDTLLPRETELTAANKALQETMQQAGNDLRSKGRQHTKAAIADRLKNAITAQNAGGGTN